MLRLMRLPFRVPVRSRLLTSLMLAAALLGAGAYAALRQSPRDAEAKFHEPFRATGEVLRLADGDSFTFRSSERGEFEVRMHAVDAPERVQAHGEKSREALRALVDGKRVTVDCYKTDPRGRAICRVYQGKLNVELALVERGAAWHYTQFVEEQTRQERETLAAAQRAAQQAKRGLWAAADPMPPWSCRQRLRSAQLCR